MDAKTHKRRRKESGEANKTDLPSGVKLEKAKRDNFNTVKTPNDLTSLSDNEFLFYSSAKTGHFGL